MTRNSTGNNQLFEESAIPRLEYSYNDLSGDNIAFTHDSYIQDFILWNEI